MKKNKSVEISEIIDIICFAILFILFFALGLLIICSAIENIKNGADVKINQSFIFCGGIICFSVFCTAAILGYFYLEEKINK